jgi:hypothetical protein
VAVGHEAQDYSIATPSLWTDGRKYGLLSGARAERDGDRNFISPEGVLRSRLRLPLAFVVLAALTSACSLFSPAPESRPVRPGSARDPTGSAGSAAGGEQAPAVSLADLSWGWSREEGAFEEGGESAALIRYERDNAASKSRNGLHRVVIAHETVNRPIPLVAVDVSLIGFQEALMGAIRGTVDTRTMVYVNGPNIGRRSKWSSIEFTAADGVPTKVYSVVFLEDRSLAVVTTIATQGTARLQDTATIAQDVADRLAGRDTLELPVMKTTGA